LEIFDLAVLSCAAALECGPDLALLNSLLGFVSELDRADLVTPFLNVLDFFVVNLPIGVEVPPERVVFAEDFFELPLLVFVTGFVALLLFFLLNLLSRP